MKLKNSNCKTRLLAAAVSGILLGISGCTHGSKTQDAVQGVEGECKGANSEVPKILTKKECHNKNGTWIVKAGDES